MSTRPLNGWWRFTALAVACQMVLLPVGQALAEAAVMTGAGAGAGRTGRAAWIQERAPELELWQEQDQEKLTVGVLDLEANGVDAGEARAITERLRIWLGRTQTFQVIERNQMESIMAEMGFQFSGACDTDECVVQVGRVLGASKMVAGSVSKVGSLYSLQIRIIDISTSRIEYTAFKDEPGGIEAVLTVAAEAVANELAANVSGRAVQREQQPARQPEQPVVQQQPETQPSAPGEDSGQQRPRRRNGWLYLLFLGAAGGGAALALGGGGGDSGPDRITAPPSRPVPPQ